MSVLVNPAAAISGGQAAPRYVAVIDAGSSGSRIYLYDTRRDENGHKSKVLMEFESDAPGLSSFKEHSADAGVKGLAPLLERLSDFLPSKNIPKKEVTIDVLATAGMRLLESDAQKAIFDSVKKYIAENAFPVGKIETISGGMEGVYSWVDVNDLLGNFRRHRPPVGIIEVGGASAQIAFETTRPDAHSEAVIVGNRKYKVFVQSFLGLGRNEARKHMIQTSASAIHIGNNPCYPRGLVVDDPKAGAKGLIGDFNDEFCVGSYENVLAPFEIQSVRDQVKNGPASFAAIGTGNPVGTFWGLLDAWKITSSNPFEIAEKAKAGCNKSWSDFEAEYGGAMFNKTQCADSAFITLFLYGAKGLNLGKATVTSYRAIDGQTPTWTRGFVILEYQE